MDALSVLQFQVIAAAGVVILVILSWMMGFRERARIVSLAPIAQNLGVTLSETLIDAEGRAGIGLSVDGRLLVAKAMGADVAARVAPVSAIEKLDVKDGDVKLALSDWGFPDVRVRVAQVPLWIGRLAR